ncbi:GNAT family N-acetyltransferase [Paracoccus sp. (in: a-proteobacteria)]|uniref:GNAT family N-acetyltransferase n=1 Tax=Paracoccus sp. TaxID=267 RepID=UPI002898C38C|nr:GNAT family N-acetyltransferase [Paracoccus sp. (in: a-proteobacteria)]
MKLWHIDPDRAAEWREIRLESLRLDSEAFGSRYEDWCDVPAAGFEQRLRDARHFGAGEVEGQPLAVGCWQAGMVGEDPFCGWVMSVYARPEARGRGYVDRVMQHIAQDAAAQGMTSLGLHVVTTNTQALRLYQRLGFVDSGKSGIVSGMGHPEYKMILDLSGDKPAGH